MDTRISDKLVRSGKTLDVIGKVLAILCIVAAFMALVAIPVAVLLPEDIVFRIMGYFPSMARIFGEMSLGTWISTTVVATLKGLFIVSAVGFIFYCGLCAVVLFILSAVFKATAVHRTPFLSQNVKRLRIIGIILIVASVALGLTNLIFAFCVFALAYVLQYGVELQQQSDETL